MKLITAAVIAALLLPTAARAQQPGPPTLTLREGTEVRLKLAQDVNSRASKEGQAVELVLAVDLKVEDKVVAKAGSRALGTIIHAKKPDFWGEAGEVNMRLSVLKAGNVKVPLRGAVGTVGVRYVVIRGSQAIVKAGTEVQAYVAADTQLQESSGGG